MADTQPAQAPVDAQQPAVTEEHTTNGEAPIAEEDVETASKEATTAVNAPNGEGTAEAAVGPTEETEAPAAKDKKRKSTGGVPEHKMKKLNKKKSTTTLRMECQPGDLYWARLKGYPPWPSVICDEEMLPETLLASRPVSAARPDGSVRDDFKEGGKNAKDRTFPIMFLSTNEFSWLINTSLTPLDPEECKHPAGKLNKALAKAYEIAADKPDLDYFKGLLQQFQEEVAAYEAAQREREAEAEEKAAAKAKRDADKKARKSKGGEDDGDVEMADGDKPSKKRKKDTDSDGEKLKKTPKITKLNAPKQNGDTAKKAAKPKAKKAAAPKKEAEQEAPMTESERLQHREKHVLFLRHKLQKAFLSRETAPKDDEMPNMSDFFKQLEVFDDLEPELIRKTKIHKVLKGIVKLDNVPRDEEFNFKQRSQTMLETWNRRMEADAAAAATNGEGASGGDEEKSAEKEDDKAVDKSEEKETSAEEGDEKPAGKDVGQSAENGDEKAKTEAKAEEAAESKQAPEQSNAGENAAAPDAKDADGDIKMDDKAAGTEA